MTETAGAPSPRRISVAHLVLIVPWIALVRDAWEPIADTSFLWHVRAGSLQTSGAAVLTSDPFSFTRGGEPWRTQSWLVELLYAWGERVSDLTFVPMMILLTSLVIFVGLGLLAYRASRSVPATAFVLVLTTFLMISFLVPRPVLVSYALFVLVVLAWEKPSTRWAVPLLMWVWAASHGSFPLGLAYVGLALVMRREWRWIPTAVAAGVATLFTAHGLGIADFLAGFAENRSALEFISEWRKPTITDPIVIPFAGGILFVVLGAFRRLIEPRHLWLLVPFLALGMTAIRSVPPAWIALVPLVALSLSDLTIGMRAGFSFGKALIFGAAVLVIPFLVRQESGLPEDRMPLAAATELDDVNTFHDDRSGGYLIWARGPEFKVFIDDRAELYGDRLEEFVALVRGTKDWEAVFERDHIDQALLKKDMELAEDIQAAGWSKTYEDDHYVVLRP